MIHLRNEGPIGVFDAGLGGLTVLRALHERLPHEDFVYLGDTARAPYGSRGAQTVLNYAHACARVLREQRIKLLVIASHTVSAVALEPLAAELFMPVLGAIVPGLAALTAAGKRRIGVLASPRCALSGAYGRALAALCPDAQALVQSSPLLSALLDEGLVQGELPRLALRHYLAPLLSQQVDSVLLGASCYPLLLPLVHAELAALGSPQLPVLDSAQPLADEVVATVAARQLATARTDPGKLRVVFTDLPESFSAANRYLGQDLRRHGVSAIDV
jgi:glutamate racemase